MYATLTQNAADQIDARRLVVNRVADIRRFNLKRSESPDGARFNAVVGIEQASHRIDLHTSAQMTDVVAHVISGQPAKLQESVPSQGSAYPLVQRRVHRRRL